MDRPLTQSVLEPPRTTPERPPRTVRLSVIVPIHNRPGPLRELLEALTKQSYPRDGFEVLVCDDGSTEDLTAVIAAARAEGLPVVHLRQARRGPGLARNLGLAAARGEILAFTDSDCLPAADWLTVLGRAMESPAVGLVGGEIGFRGAHYFSGQCLNFLMSSTLGAAGARDPRGMVHVDFYPRAGNLAVRRALAEAAGGFSGARYGEDLEFSHRIRAQGVEARFVPEATLIHNERRDLSQMTVEAFRKGRARVRLTRLFGMHQLLHAMPAMLAAYVLAGPALALLWPAARVGVAVPGLLYLLVLGVLAVQGAWVLRDPRALVGVPLCALAIHFGYGAGYLAAWICREGGAGDRALDRALEEG